MRAGPKSRRHALTENYVQDFIYEDKKSEAEAGGNGTAYEEGCPEITRERQLLAGE